MAQVMIAEVQIAAIAGNRRRLSKIKFKHKVKQRVSLRRRIAVPRKPIARASPSLGQGPPIALHLLAIAYGPPTAAGASSKGNPLGAALPTLFALCLGHWALDCVQ